MEEKIIQVLKKQRKTPVTEKELIAKLSLNKTQLPDFDQSLDQLVRQGTVLFDGRRYVLTENLGYLPAVIVKVNATFGFAHSLVGSKEDPDIFIPGRLLMGSMPQDVVIIRLIPSKGELPEGEVVQIAKEAEQEFIGVFRENGGRCEIVPDKMVRFPIGVSRSLTMDAKDGDKVLAKLVSRGKRHDAHRAEVVCVFGDAQKAKNCCEAVLRASGAPLVFSQQVLDEAEALSKKGIDPKELIGRTDLRSETLFTIDSADSKDLDDAVSLKKEENGWLLGVHIADVSHYVRSGTELDRSAFERGTSLYYADSVIPMLPQALSNGICSLNPGEDRLAFSAFLSINLNGELTQYRFEKSVIRSRVKGVYSEINQILAGNAEEAILQKYEGLTSTIFEMQKLSELLTKKRFERGAVNLETTETKIIVGPDGRAQELRPRVRGISERIIEEFMLVANQAAAMLAEKESLPFLYRIHEDPSSEKLGGLEELLNLLGIEHAPLKKGCRPAELSKILEQVRGSSSERLLNNAILRSMAKAQYSEKNKGHFGLVLQDYAHFTSPIRRYPDLSIHRILTDFLNGMQLDKIQKKYSDFVKEASVQATDTEIRAMSAERDCEDCYKAEYMSQYLGECFDGIISSVASHGIYAELENTAEGLVRIETLGSGRCEYDGRMQISDPVSKKIYQVGMPVQVRVLSTDTSAGQIDFELLEDGKPPLPLFAPDKKKSASSRSDTVKNKAFKPEQKRSSGRNSSGKKKKGGKPYSSRKNKKSSAKRKPKIFRP